MKFNFNLTPTDEVTVTCGNLFVTLPRYGDLLGYEYNVEQEELAKEQVWQSKVLDLTSTIAGERGISLWEVSQLMVAAEGGNAADQFEILGDHVNEFMSLLSQKPSEHNRNFAIATAVLKRVDPDITVDKVRQLPMNLIYQIIDFVDMEKVDGAHLSYSEATHRARILEEENNRLRETLDKVKGVKHPDVIAAFEELDNNVLILKNADLSNSTPQ